MKPYRHSRVGGNLALKIISRLFAVFGLLMIFAVSGWGVVLDSDTFATNTDGWSGTNVVWNSGSGGQLFMNKDQAATKTFNLGAAYANKTVNITMTTTEIGGWESDDVTQITANGTPVYNSNVAGALSFSATLNASGQLIMSVMPNTNNSAENLYMDNFVINYTPPPPPVISDTTRTVAENSPASTNVGAVIPATNSPTGYTITGGTGSALFDISATGQITVKSGAVLDYETTPSYTLLVKATNGGGDSNIATITINLTDILVPLVTAGQSFSLLTGTANGTVVGTVATTVTTPTAFTITGTTFAISSAGVITVADSAGLVAGSGTYTVNASTSEGGDSKPITITVTQRYSDLELANTDNVDPVITNQSYSYTVGVYNAGPHEATNLILTDILPVGVTYQSAVGTGWTCSESSGVVTCTKPTLAANTPPNSNVVITVLAPVIGGVITNTATVTSSGIDLIPTTNTDVTQNTTVQAKADLKIVKTGPASVVTNNTIQYSLMVTNLGPSASKDLNVTDILPAGLVFNNAYAVANDWICSYDTPSRKISCTHPTTLEINIPSEIVLVVTAPSTVPSPANVVNTATVTGPLIDPVTTNNSSSATTTITGSSFSSSNERPFALQKNYNINGNMKIIGNSMLLKSDGTCASTGTNNNDISTIWANRDSDGTTWNSSSADLALPKGVNSSKIKYAGLVWQGRVSSAHDDAAFWAAAKTIKFKAPGLAYQTLTSSDAKYNWTLRSSDANYQGAVDVTDILKQSIDTVPSATIASTGFSGTFWGANVQAEKMKNGFGAWSLVIVYEDNTDTLKNISVYDGYVSVDDGETIPTTLSGFLTPSAGPVDAKFLVFAGEGDVTLTDSVTLSNSSGDQSLGSNIFNSSETINGAQVISRDPSCQNTIGIDIDTFNVGTTSSTTPIIKNSQTSTTVKLKSTGDVYYPGTFAFSTELYVPRVCYNETVTFGGLPITANNIPATGNQVEYTTTIINKDAEDANGVFVEKVFDTPSQISYAADSLKIAPIPAPTTYTGKTDKTGDDTAEYVSGSATAKLLLGTGAAWYQGGTILQNQETSFKYRARVGDQNVSESGYKLSYRNDLLHLTFDGISAPKCGDFNNSFLIFGTVPDTAVSFDAWETSIVDSTPPIESDRKIYAKIVNLSRQLKIASIDGSAYSNYTNGLVGWRLVPSEMCPSGDNNITGWSDINLSVTNPNIITLNGTTAHENLRIQFGIKNDGYVDRNCSTDNFAIRPESYNITLSPNGTLHAGSDFTMTSIARGSSDFGLSGYSGNAVVNTSTKILSCPVPDGNITNFSGGQLSTITFNGVDTNLSENIKFGDVGEFDMNITDSTWTNVDVPDDCIVDSNETVPNNGKVGCLVRSHIDITVIPDHFGLVTTFNNHSPNGFTYLSDDLNMSADLNVTVSAQNLGDIVTKNYNTSCYAKDTSYVIDYITNPSPGINLIYFETNSSTSGSVPISSNFSVTGMDKSVFSEDDNGTAHLDFKLNFDRNQTVAVNPFDMNVTEINVEDVDNVLGSELYSDKQVNFVYGRVIPRDIRVFGPVGYTANAWYEVYNASTLNGTPLPASKNEAMWYINTFHSDVATSYDGDANVTFVIPSTGSLPNSTSSYAAGIESYNFTAVPSASIPYSAKAHINTDPWLWYGVSALGYADPGMNVDGTVDTTVNADDCFHHPCFNINIVPPIGATGSAKSNLQDAKGNKRSSEGTGTWHSTTDYAPAVR